MRRAITLLQCASQLNNRRVDEETVFEVAGTLPPDALAQVWEATRTGPFNKIAEAVRTVLALGYSTTMMLAQVYELVMGAEDLSDVQRADMLLKLAKVDHALVKGADERLQLLDMCGEFTLIRRRRG